MKTMGERIRMKRLECGLTQEQLAQKLNVRRQVVYKLENGKLKTIDRSRIDQLAGIFQCSEQWLLGLENTKVKVTYHARGRESVTAYVDSKPIIGKAALKQELYRAAMTVHPDNYEIAIELLKSLSQNK